MDLICKLFVIGFTVGICGLACAYGVYQFAQDTARKIIAPVLADNAQLKHDLETANMKIRRKDVELAELEKLRQKLRQALFEAKAENVLIKEKNPSSDR